MNIEQLNRKFNDAKIEEVLDYFLNNSNLKIGFASSLGAEDQLLTDLIAKISPKSKIFTLDTGRLPKETYTLLDATMQMYKDINIDVYFPDSKEVEEMVKQNGINLFYDSIEKRKMCCKVRKINPLKRALKGLDGWITGLRSAQSVTREEMKLVEFDEAFGIIKINPLINYTQEEVWEYLKKNRVPYNKLHENGYPSIGCEPCTRAIKEHQNIRDGRWWWENPEHKECGLHIKEKR
jgi:phosphoadenosine phosphosulfate reductase